MRRICIIILFFIVVKVESQVNTLNYADSLFALGNYSKAIEHYKSIDNDDVPYKIAKAYQAIGNYDKALNHLKEAVNKNPNNSFYKYELAKMLSSVKDYESSSEIFLNLIKEDSLNPNYYYELGLIKEQTADSTYKDYFTKAFQIDTAHQKAIFKIAKYFLVKRKHDTVHYLVDKGLKSYHNNKKLISLKAQNYYWKEDYDNAIEWFNKLLDLKESTQFIHEKISYSYMKEYDYEMAIDHLEKALMFDSKNATNLYVLGQLYAKLNYFDKAEENILKALEILDQPLDKEYIKYGTILNIQKKYEEAIKIFKKALKENPNNHQASFYIVTAKEAYYSDIDEKIKLYEDFIKKHPNSSYTELSEYKIKQLKEERFMKADSTMIENKD